MFGIRYDSKLVMPFELEGVIAFIKIQFPTAKEVQELKQIELACIHEWSLVGLIFACHAVHMYQT